MAVNNNRRNNTLNDYETNKRTKEDQLFPEILGQSGKGKEASRTLATAANDSRRGQSNDGKQKGFPTEKFLAHLEVEARQQGTWRDNINSLGTLVSIFMKKIIFFTSTSNRFWNEL